MEPPQSIVSHPVHLKESWATLQHLTLRMAELHGAFIVHALH